MSGIAVPSLASLWQQWTSQRSLTPLPPTTLRGGAFRLNKGGKVGDYRWRRHNDGPMAGSICGVELYLPRHDPGKFLGQTNIDNMLNKLLSHPMVAFGTMQQDSRKLKRTTFADHESWYNITFTTNFNTSMTLGYSHADDAPGMTHLWALYCAFWHNYINCIYYCI